MEEFEVFAILLDKNGNRDYANSMDRFHISAFVKTRFEWVDQIDEDGQNLIDEIKKSGKKVITHKSGFKLELLHTYESKEDK